MAGSAALAACSPEVADIITTATSTLSPTLKEPLIPSVKSTSTLAPAAPSPTSIQSLTPTFIPEATPNVWNLPPSKRAEILSKPENLKLFIKNQFDEEQYKGMEIATVNKGNTCGQASLAAAVDIGLYFTTGKKEISTTIASVRNVLVGRTFPDNGGTTNFILGNDSMCIAAFPYALQLLIPEHILKVESLTPDYDGYAAGVTRIVPQTAWPDALIRAQNICAAGGGVFFSCYKYGYGHFVIATDVRPGVKKDGSDATAIIGDSHSTMNGQLGITQRMRLIDYFDSITDPKEAALGQRLGLFNITGFTFK